MTYIIVDFEATCCDKGSFPRDEMEIIEIGAVALKGSGPEIQGKFCSFIKPVRNPVLTSFCTELTTITQEMVDKAETFPDVLADFKKWLEGLADPVFCSWGDYDKGQLKKDCAYHEFEYPFSDKHINIKKRFAKNKGLAKPCGVSKALKIAGMKFEGQIHRGIDDATNMARLSEFIFD